MLLCVLDKYQIDLISIISSIRYSMRNFYLIKLYVMKLYVMKGE